MRVKGKDNKSNDPMRRALVWARVVLISCIAMTRQRGGASRKGAPLDPLGLHCRHRGNVSAR